MRRSFLSLLVLALIGSVFVPVADSHVGGPPSGEPKTCTGSDNYVKSCFEINGDDFWVYDDDRDFRSAVIFYETARGGTGECRNAHGIGKWHECLFDMNETGPSGCTNVVQWWHYTYDAQTNDYNYISGPYSSYVDTPPTCPV